MDLDVSEPGGMTMLLAVLFGWLFQAAPAAPQPPELLLLSRWVRSVERHEPAKADVEAATIAIWSTDDLRTRDRTLRTARRAAAPPVANDWPGERRASALEAAFGCPRAGADAARPRRDDEALWLGDVNRLRRGAMLHSDIAMLAQEGLIRAAEPTVPEDAAGRADPDLSTP